MLSQTVSRIKKIRWVSRWAGSYTFISCSYWGPQYYHSLSRNLKVHFNHTLFIHRKGVVSFFVPESEFRNLGQYLAKKSEKSLQFTKGYCNRLKRSTDVLLPMMRKLRKSIPTLEEYQQFLKVFDNHLAFHVFIKKTVDFLSVKGVERLLPYFKDARLYSEKVYSESETFFRSIMKIISRKEGYPADYLTCLTRKEFETYIVNKTLPPKKQLQKRFQASALFFENDTENIILGRSVGEVEKIVRLQTSQKKNEVKGVSAYPGKVSGIARIILDPHKSAVFNDGDILITGMTRPEFMPFIRKASAIVTDVGGVLSHAAITAREIKVPCIVGTGTATKTFKNGQKLEVDAYKGLVKVI